MRINLQTGREYRVAIPPADQFEPVAWIALHGRVLLRRAKNEYGPLRSPQSAGPKKPEYYLLHAATGKVRLIRGEVGPLRRKGERFLQPTDRPDEFWAARPDGSANQTQVGRYNLKDFSFKPLIMVPHIIFDSMSMWILPDGLSDRIAY